MPEFDTPGSVSLQIRLPSGRVRVTTADEPRTVVELVAKGRRGADALEISSSAPTSTAVATSSPSSRRRSSAGGRSRSTGAATSKCASSARPVPTSTLPEARPTSRSTASSERSTAKSASGDSSLHDVTKRLPAQDRQWRHLRRNDPRPEGTIVTVSGDLEIRSRPRAAERARPVSGDARSVRSRPGELHLQTGLRRRAHRRRPRYARLDRRRLGVRRPRVRAGARRPGARRGVDRAGAARSRRPASRQDGERRRRASCARPRWLARRQL